MFQLMLYRDNGSMYLAEPLLANTMDAGSDVSYVRDNGGFYLTINAMGKSTVIIEEKR